MATPHGREHTPGVQARIEHIADLMRQCKWRTGKTGRELARLWDVSLDVVEYASSAASSLVKEEMGDPTRTAAVASVVLEKLLFDALEEGDRKNAISAARTLVELVGARAPRKTDVTVRQLTQMTDEDLERLAKKLVDDVGKVLAAGEAPPPAALPGPELVVTKVEDDRQPERQERRPRRR